MSIKTVHKDLEPSGYTLPLDREHTGDSVEVLPPSDGRALSQGFRFQRTIQRTFSAKCSALLAQNAAQHPHAENRNDQQETKQAPAGQGLVRRNAATCQNMQAAKVAEEGLEPPTLGL